LRNAGIEPHPFGLDADGAVVAGLKNRLPLVADLDSDNLHVSPRDSPLRSAPPPRYFGVDRAQFPIPGPGDPPALAEAAAYGSFLAVMEDVAALGAGLFREPVTSDLIWHHVFPYEYNGNSAQPKYGEIPVPADILENLRADDFIVLWRFSLWLCSAIGQDVQIFPTVFARGGGEGLNSDPHADKEATIFDPSVQIQQSDGTFLPAEAPDGTSWQDCIDGKPAHQNSVLIPSVWGWNAWYWDRFAMELPEGGTSEQYQRYALNVYNGDATDPDQPARIDTYDGMVPLRKSLAVAAFGLGIGEFLAAWDTALREEGVQLSDYVPHLEFGAEMDEQWARLDVVTGSIAPLQSEQIQDLRGDPAFIASYREYGRFHAVLARSIHEAFPGIRFKASELSSWATIGQSAGRSLWLGEALTTGIDAEDYLMQQVIEIRRAGAGWVSTLGYERAEDWVSVARYAQFRFPSILFTLGSAAPAVSIVGFHWFHYWARTLGTGDWGYQNETEAWDYTVEPFLALVQGPCAAAGRPVTWGVGNVGFPSEFTPVVDASGNVHLEAYFANSQMVQAQTLVRLFLAFIGWGAQNALWFCHMSDKRPYSSGEFATMGLRYDSASTTSALPPASTDAWPKASWWALRRLSTLCSHAGSFSVRHNEGGLVMIRLSAGASGFKIPGSLRGRTWQYAWIFWLDGAGRTLPYVTADVSLEAPDGFVRVALVPQATAQGAAAVSGAAYADSTEPDWNDGDPGSMGRFGNCTQEWMPETVGQVRVRIYRNIDYNDPAAAALPAPSTLDNLGIVAWLTNSAQGSCRGNTA
jgi:hypothetical protein